MSCLTLSQDEFRRSGLPGAGRGNQRAMMTALQVAPVARGWRAQCAVDVQDTGRHGLRREVLTLSGPGIDAIPEG
jgi:hypothetical protein